MLLLIDGDVLAYRTCKPRWLDHINRVQIKYTELEYSEEEALPTYTEEENEQYIKDSWKLFKSNLKELMEKLFAVDTLMAVSGSWNFRDYIYPKYKENRRKRPHPLKNCVNEMRKLAVKNNLAIAADGCEADDFLRIWAEECRFNNVDYCVCTIDKDLKCIPGKYYNIVKDTLEDISIEEANRYFYQQLLSGDPTDNIPGLFRIGPIKAQSLLEPFHEEQEMQEVIVSKYIDYYGDGWHDQLLSNVKLLYLQKHPYDYFSLRSWPVVKELRC